MPADVAEAGNSYGEQRLKMEQAEREAKQNAECQQMVGILLQATAIRDDPAAMARIQTWCREQRELMTKLLGSIGVDL